MYLPGFSDTSKHKSSYFESKSFVIFEQFNVVFRIFGTSLFTSTQEQFKNGTFPGKFQKFK